MGWKIGGMDIDGLKAAQLASMFANNAQIYAAGNPGQMTAAAGLQDSAQGSVAAFAAEKAAKKAEKEAKKQKLGSALMSLGGIGLGAAGGAIIGGGAGAAAGAVAGLGNSVGAFANMAAPGMGSMMGGLSSGFAAGNAINAPVAVDANSFQPSITPAVGPPRDVGSMRPAQVASYARESPDYFKGYLSQGGTLTPRQMSAAGMNEQARDARRTSLDEWVQTTTGWTKRSKL